MMNNINRELLENYVKEFNKIKSELDNLETRKNDLNDKIKFLMTENSLKEFITTGGVSAKISTKETIKYKDEPAMIKWLKENNLSKYITEKITTTPLNSELKKSQSLTESLNPYIERSVTYTLAIK